LGFLAFFTIEKVFPDDEDEENIHKSEKNGKKQEQQTILEQKIINHQRNVTHTFLHSVKVKFNLFFSISI
jgi:hypothetical protein